MGKLILFTVLLLCVKILPQLSNSNNIIGEAKDNEDFSYTDFKQIVPEIGNLSSEKTEVQVKYDNENLYVNFNLFYKNPENIFASVLERDQSLDKDDYVEIIIDSYNDKNNALGFQTNLLGTRRDFELTNNGQELNSSWNTFWDVSTERTDYGWTAEFVIPFSSLRYEGSETNVMGFKFIRYIKSNNETDIFPLKNTDLFGAELHLYNVQEIEFKNLQNKHPLYITPYVSGNIVADSKLNSSGTAYETDGKIFQGKNYFSQAALDKILSNVGIDVKYRLNNSTSLDFTLNTDFAQAEADDRIINLTRYSISLPEKRPFFLENRDFFSASASQHQVFYSRRIGIQSGYKVPIIAGVRFTGNSNNFQYGLMNIQTNRVDNLNLEAQNFSVVRLVKYFSENNSYIGGIFTNKNSTESSSFNRVIGFDGKYFFNDEISSNFFVFKSFNTNSANAHNNSYGIGVNKYQKNGYILNYSYRDYQKLFDTQMGFIVRPNTKRLIINNGYAVSFKDNSIFSAMDFGQYHVNYWISETNQPEYSFDNLYFNSRLKNGASLSAFLPVFERDHLYAPWKFSDNITIPAGKYEYTTYEIYYNSGNGNKINFEVNPIWGSFYGGSQFKFLSSLNVIFSQKFSTSFEFNYYNFSFPEAYSNYDKIQEIFTSYSARLNYSFSSKFSLKAFFQYDNLSKNIGSNVRLRFNPLEGTDLYIVYNQNTNTDRNRFSPPKPLIESQALVIKFSRTFIF